MSFVLYIDDDADSAEYLNLILPSHTFLHVIKSLKQFEAFERSEVDLVIIDPEFANGAGMRLIPVIRQIWARSLVVALSNRLDSKTIVLAIKTGAHHFLPKPIMRQTLEEQLSLVYSAFADRQSYEEDYRSGLAALDLDFLPYSYQFRQRIVAILGRHTETELPILAIGEHGTGRRGLAAKIHAFDSRFAKLSRHFLDLDARDFETRPGDLCRKIHERFGLASSGPATGNRTTSKDPVYGGTVYISDIDQFSPDTLPRLSTQIAAANARGKVTKQKVRFIVSIPALTQVKKNSSLWRFLDEHFFANHLAHPPLRKHPEDIPRLAQYYLNQIQVGDEGPVRFELSAIEMLRQHTWPGNLSELRQTIRRAAFSVKKDAIDASDIYIENMGGGFSLP